MTTCPDRPIPRRVAFWTALCAFVLPIYAARAECQTSQAAPSFTLEIAKTPVSYKLNEATETLSTRARENGTALGRGSRLLGLTVNEYDLQIVVALDRNHLAGGRCATLQNAAITASSELEVLVDGRFEAGTCQQRAIVDHENEHVAVFREALTYYEPGDGECAAHGKSPVGIGGSRSRARLFRDDPNGSCSCARQGSPTRARGQ